MPPKPFSMIKRYRTFLCSRDTIIAAINGLLLLAGFIASIAGNPDIGRWLYFASAVIGGIPLFLLASKAVFLRHDITAGFMASVAMIAAILVGEYSAAALVVFMFAIGDWLENLTMARADNALKDLSSLTPPSVVVVRGGREQTIPIEEVVPGDLFLVRSGERIGLDGVIQSGSGSINQSVITGESIPVEKSPGDEVYAGTLNECGAVEVRVTRAGTDTTLGQITRLVKDAQQSQAPVQRLANRYARVLVPITFGIAILVYLLSGDITRAITVLVVVCPCALVLATPTAVTAAIGSAARQGILIKSGAVIEQIGRVDVIAFDKTGTLTNGQPTIQRIIPLDGLSSPELLAYAAAVEWGSEHAIGQAIVRTGRDQGLERSPVEDFIALPGFGVSGRVNQHPVLIGSRALFSERQIPWTEAVDQQIRILEAEGQTVIPVALDGTFQGLISLADTPRSAAPQVVADLKNMGIREVILITGDNPRTADRIAGQLGIDRIFAEVLPQDKLSIIRTLQAEGKRVAFVGDGINDAPALAAADVGIAMGLAGTDLALETAGIGLMADEIERIPQIIALSRQTIATIRQNVIFSMSINVLSVALGGFGIIGPAVGALLHETSALPVLANSARLINFKSKHGKVNQTPDSLLEMA